MDNSLLDKIEQILNYKFNDRKLLIRAFTHSSYANMNNSYSYERLEFLGDSILGYIISDELIRLYPSCNEGELTKIKQNIVSTGPLSRVIRSLNLDGYLLRAKKTLVTDSMCEDVFESIIAAIYLDSNLEEAKKFVMNMLSETISKIDINSLEDSKSKLLEKFTKEKVEFIEKKKEGTDNNPLFTISLYINGQEVSSAVAKKKSIAEQICAKNYLKSLKM